MPAVRYSRDALRTLGRLPESLATLIRGKVEQYARHPEAQANNVKALKGEPGIYRLRVGDWRVLFSKEGVVIAVIRVAPRGAAYD